MNFLEAANYDRIVKEIDKLNTKSSDRDTDERFWQPHVDKAGNGYAVIRFLPTPAVDGAQGMPWIKMVSHGFQGPTGQWYIENSLTTIGLADPVAELNSKLWNSGIEADKNTARNQRMRKHYISNIYVVKDPANPENEGKVFLFKYGAKIFTKIQEAMKPQFGDEEPINPFNLLGEEIKDKNGNIIAAPGANFKIKIRNVEGYRNYDRSEFDSPSALSDDHDFLDKIHKSEYSLLEFHDPKNFKTYDQLKQRLDFVLNGPSGPTRQSVDQEIALEAELEDEIPFLKEETDTKNSDDDKEILEYFQSLASDD